MLVPGAYFLAGCLYLAPYAKEINIEIDGAMIKNHDAFYFTIWLVVVLLCCHYRVIE